MAIRIGTNARDYFGNGTVRPGHLDGGRLDETGFNTITALGGNDTILGTAAADRILPGLGNDLVHGGGGIDTISYEDAPAAVTVDLAITRAQNTVGSGRDRITQIENLVGSEFGDRLSGTKGGNRIEGLGGDDLIQARGGNDLVYGGAGDDLVLAGNGDDIAEGGLGNDLLVGGAGNDILRGQAGDDALVGGVGNDRHTGGKGSDILAGGDGTDRYVWTVNCLTFGTFTDVITSFTEGETMAPQPGITAAILGYFDAGAEANLPATWQGVPLDDDPTILDGRVRLQATQDGVTYTTTVWVLDIGDNALTFRGSELILAS